MHKTQQPSQKARKPREETVNKTVSERSIFCRYEYATKSMDEIIIDEPTQASTLKLTRFLAVYDQSVIVASFVYFVPFVGYNR